MDFRVKWIAAMPLLLLVVCPAAWAQAPTGAVFPTVSYLDRLDQVAAESAVPEPQADCGCVDDCGATCGGGCCDPPCPLAAGYAAGGGLYAGFSSVVVQPHITQNSAYEEATYDAGSDTYIYEKKPFGFDYEWTPRFWLGYVGYGGFGVRCRYWQFDYAGDSVHLEDADAWDDHYFMGKAKIPCNEPKWYLRGGLADITYGLELHAADFEVTQQIDFWAASIIFNCGIRYARVVQDYDVVGEDAFWGLFEFHTGHIFEGVGPTFGLEVHRPIGSRGLALYGITRGSVLLGDADAYIRTATQSWQGNSEHSYSGDDVIGVYEGQIGVEYTREIAFGYLILRCGYEGQLWCGLGAPNNSECGAALGFEGFTFDIGLSR